MLPMPTLRHASRVAGAVDRGDHARSGKPRRPRLRACSAPAMRGRTSAEELIESPNAVLTEHVGALSGAAWAKAPSRGPVAYLGGAGLKGGFEDARQSAPALPLEASTPNSLPNRAPERQSA